MFRNKGNKKGFIDGDVVDIGKVCNKFRYKETAHLT